MSILWLFVGEFIGAVVSSIFFLWRKHRSTVGSLIIDTVSSDLKDLYQLAFVKDLEELPKYHDICLTIKVGRIEEDK